MAYRIDGPLFFAAAHRFLRQLAETTDVKVVILRLSRVSTMDATGARVLGDVIDKLGRRHVRVLLSGARPDHLRTLDALGVLTGPQTGGRVFGATPEAIAYARAHLHTTGVLVDTAGT